MMNRFIDTINEYSAIGVAGMCKNAGKTTVVNHIIDEYHDGYIIGITSIGYDGEDIDEITRLNKPRVQVYPKMIVSTCEECLKNTTAEYRKIEHTGIRTALGEVVILRIKGEGIVEIAGPSMVSQIEVLTNKMESLGADKIIVDGSAGRLSFASRMECCVLSVGAALSKDMSKVINLAKHQIDMLNLPQCEMSYAIKFSGNRPYATLKDDDEVKVIFRGAMVSEDLNDIILRYKGYKKTVVVNDASSVFLTRRAFKKFEQKSGLICVQNKTNLAAVTINPMSPYGKWFDKDKFLENMQKEISLPVFNVFNEKEQK